MSYTQFTSAVQTKLWQYCDKFKSGFKKPEHNFIHQMLFGILKSGRVEINSIARNLQEDIRLKNVHKRIGSHLGKAGMWRKISEATLKAQSWALKNCRFVLYDLSDIQKEYAKKMDGLAYVYDGSKGTTGNGYWLSNVSAVDGHKAVHSSRSILNYIAMKPKSADRTRKYLMLLILSWLIAQKGPLLLWTGAVTAI